MKNKINRVIATGLIALMIANFTSCDELTSIINGKGNVQTPTESSTPNSNPSSGGVTSTTNPNGNNKNPDTILQGSIWDAIKDSKYVNYSNFSASLASRIDYKPVPFKFLQDIGLLTYDNKGNVYLNGKHIVTGSDAIKVRVFLDENTNENDVYLLMQYNSEKIGKESGNPNVDLSTWKLKYTLDDINYQTLLQLNGDFRASFFIQEMDKQFEPEIITHTVVNYNIVSKGSCLRDKDNDRRGFPYEYVANVDLDNQIITYATRSEEGYRFYDLDLRESTAWDYYLQQYNLTEEELEEYINIQTKSTILGTCLTKFDVDLMSAGVTNEQAKELFNATDRIHELKECNVHSLQKNNSLER